MKVVVVKGAYLHFSSFQKDLSWGRATTKDTFFYSKMHIQTVAKKATRAFTNEAKSFYR